MYVVAFFNSNLRRVLNTTLPFSKLINFVNCSLMNSNYSRAKRP